MQIEYDNGAVVMIDGELVKETWHQIEAKTPDFIRQSLYHTEGNSWIFQASPIQKDDACRFFRQAPEDIACWFTTSGRAIPDVLTTAIETSKFKRKQGPVITSEVVIQLCHKPDSDELEIEVTCGAQNFSVGPFAEIADSENEMYALVNAARMIPFEKKYRNARMSVRKIVMTIVSDHAPFNG